MQEKKKVYLVDDNGEPLKKVFEKALGEEFEFILE